MANKEHNEKATKQLVDLEALLVAVGSTEMRVAVKNTIIKMILDEIKFYEHKREEEEK